MVKDFGIAEISFVIISKKPQFVKRNLRFFLRNFGNTFVEVIDLKRVLIFLTGGAAYVGLELLYRGRSHISMFAAGGLCLLLVGHLNEVEPRLPMVFRVPLGAAVITVVELGIGLLVNRGYQVWDYRSLPGNLWGQVCPQFFLLWLPLSWVAMRVYGKMRELQL